MTSILLVFSPVMVPFLSLLPSQLTHFNKESCHSEAVHVAKNLWQPTANNWQGTKVPQSINPQGTEF